MKVYEKTGVLTQKDLCLPSKKELVKGVAIIECVQEIPCNPCVTVCPTQAISMMDINDTPNIDYALCVGCGKCVGICPGLAIFVVQIKDDKALITLPYEFLPLPKKGDVVQALDREGKTRGKAVVQKVIKSGSTAVVTIEVEKSLAMDIRHIKVESHE